MPMSVWVFGFHFHLSPSTLVPAPCPLDTTTLFLSTLSLHDDSQRCANFCRQFTILIRIFFLFFSLIRYAKFSCIQRLESERDKERECRQRGCLFKNNTLGSFLHFFFCSSSSSLHLQFGHLVKLHFSLVFILFAYLFLFLDKFICISLSSPDNAAWEVQGEEGVEVEGSGAYLMASFVCGCSFWTSSTDNASEILSNECLMLPVCTAGQLRGRTSVCECKCV